MSLNHIQSTISDNQKFDVKFKTVYCDQVVTGSGPGPGPQPVSGDGYIDAFTGSGISSNTTGVVADSPFFNNTTAIKNHSTFIWNVKANITISAPTNFYEMDLTLPTAIKNYFDTHPTSFANAFMSVQGASNTTTATPSFVANMMYYANNATKLSSSAIRITMQSFSGNGTGTIPSEQKFNLQITFSGPAE